MKGAKRKVKLMKIKFKPVILGYILRCLEFTYTIDQK